MSELEKTFAQAAVDVRTLPSKPDTMTLLKLYALYKQGSQGDISGQRPQGFDPVGNAKYNAWAELKGTPQEEAQRRYAELVNRLLGR